MSKAIELAEEFIEEASKSVSNVSMIPASLAVDVVFELRRLAALEAELNAIKAAGPVAHCALALDGKHIAFFDGKPMVMVGPVGNEHHDTPLYAIKESK